MIVSPSLSLLHYIGRSKKGTNRLPAISANYILVCLDQDPDTSHTMLGIDHCLGLYEKRKQKLRLQKAVRLLKLPH
jgi:hypothetical protein